MPQFILRLLNISFFLIFASVSSDAVGQKLDKSLEPELTEEDTSSIFKDMGVVQKKEMQKKGKFLISNFLNLEFSDGPFTNYGLNLNLGYALSDFWEIYLNTVPFFITDERPIVEKVEQLTLQGGQKASINAPKPENQFGLEVLYAFGYGKDSVGTTSILRSDTFVKFGAGIINYESDSGLRFHVAFGKTFFTGDSFGFRLVVSENYMQTILEGDKQFNFITSVELGIILYI